MRHDAMYAEHGQAVQVLLLHEELGMRVKRVLAGAVLAVVWFVGFYLLDIDADWEADL